MRKILFSLIFILTFLNGLAEGLIIPVSSLEHLYEEMNAYDENTLVVFDVDDTLMTPKDMILRPQGRELRKGIISTLSREKQKLFQEKKDLITSSVLLQREVQLVESFTPHLISLIQQKGLKVIGLTALSGGKLGLIPSMEDWRISELNALGYDFRGAFDQEVAFVELKNLPSIKVYVDEVLNTAPPSYKDGVIFSGITPKGIVLKEFFQLIGWMPKHVVFVDDHLSFLESVEENMHALGIECIAYHYSAAENLPGAFEHNVGRYQLEYVLNTGIWLSDSKALEVFKE